MLLFQYITHLYTACYPNKAGGQIVPQHTCKHLYGATRIYICFDNSLLATNIVINGVGYKRVKQFKLNMRICVNLIFEIRIS